MLADELRIRRREYFDAKWTTQERIEKIRKEIESSSQTLAEVTENLDRISDDIEARKTSKISQIANFFNIRNLESQLGIAARQKAEIETDLEEREKELDQLDSIRSDQSALFAARSEIRRYYDNLGEQYKQFEAEQRGRDVGSMMREHDAYFFHGIAQKHRVSEVNGIISDSIPLTDRLKLLLALEPTISTSTVKRRNPGG